MHPSKLLLVLATAAILAFRVNLYLEGDWRGEYYLLLLVPSVVVLTTYVWRTGDSRLLSEPLNLRRVIWNYAVEQGWWVAFWLILILLFATVFDR